MVRRGGGGGSVGQRTNVRATGCYDSLVAPRTGIADGLLTSPILISVLAAFPARAILQELTDRSFRIEGGYVRPPNVICTVRADVLVSGPECLALWIKYNRAEITHSIRDVEESLPRSRSFR